MHDVCLVQQEIFDIQTMNLNWMNMVKLLDFSLRGYAQVNHVHASSQAKDWNICKKVQVGLGHHKPQKTISNWYWYSVIDDVEVGDAPYSNIKPSKIQKYF